MKRLTMRLAIGAAVAAIASIGAVAQAAIVVPLTFSKGIYTGHFEATVSGNFTDTFSFVLPTAGKKGSFSVTSSAADASAEIIFSKGYLDTASKKFTFSTSVDPDFGTITTTGKLSQLGIAAGLHNLVFSGHVTDAATFAGAIAIRAAAVPEPASWALMIGGIGLVGGAARRRATPALA